MMVAHGGRKTCPELIAEAVLEERCRGVALAVRAGVHMNALAGVHEVSRPTIYKWKDRGEAALAAEDE